MNDFSKIGEYDTVVAEEVSCVSGVIGRLVFNKSFDELNALCLIPAATTSYISLTFYNKKRKVGSMESTCSWKAIAHLHDRGFINNPKLIRAVLSSTVS